MSPNPKKCPECGADDSLRRRAVEHVENVGGTKVKDGTAFAAVCSKCSEYDLSAEQFIGYQQRAAALVLRDGRFVNKDVVRYARKALGLRQADIAALLHVKTETISRWETGDVEIQRPEQLAIVAFLEDAQNGTEMSDLLDRERNPEPVSSAALEVPPVRRACG